VEIIAIPGREPLLAIIDVLFGHVDPTADNVGPADAIGATALRHGFAESNDPGAAGYAISGIDPAGELAR
jgi:hypothetical protein